MAVTTNLCNVRSELLSKIDALLLSYSKSTGMMPNNRRHAVVVHPKSAVVLLRTVRDWMQHLANEGIVTITHDDDELFVYRGTPVRVRSECPEGSLYVVRDDELPRRTCCDGAALEVLLTAMSLGSA